MTNHQMSTLHIMESVSQRVRIYSQNQVTVCIRDVSITDPTDCAALSWQLMVCWPAVKMIDGTPTAEKEQRIPAQRLQLAEVKPSRHQLATDASVETPANKSNHVPEPHPTPIHRAGLTAHKLSALPSTTHHGHD